MGQNQLTQLMKEKWRSFLPLYYYVTTWKNFLIKKKKKPDSLICSLYTMLINTFLLVLLLHFLTCSLCWSEMSALCYPCINLSVHFQPLVKWISFVCGPAFCFFPLHFTVHDYFSVWNAVACNLHYKMLNLNNNTFQSINQVLFTLSLYCF